MCVVCKKGERDSHREGLEEEESWHAFVMSTYR